MITLPSRKGTQAEVVVATLPCELVDLAFKPANDYSSLGNNLRHDGCSNWEERQLDLGARFAWQFTILLR